MDGEDEDDEDAFEDGLDLGSRDELTPNFSSSQYSLNRTPLIQVRFHWMDILLKFSHWEDDVVIKMFQTHS